jgi:beta-phosphoglucomutase-like phosphatase (HAD superfamily)
VGAHIYIEDSEKNIRALRDAGHKCIIFTNSTNRHMEGLRANTWDEVEEIVREEYASWRAK